MTLQRTGIYECECGRCVPILVVHYVEDGQLKYAIYVLRPHSHRDELAEEAERRVGEFRLEEDV